MAVFTLTQKIFVVKCYYKGGESVRQVLGCLQRRFGKMFGEENVEAILQIILMFETAGSIVDRVELIEPLNAPKHLKESDEFEEEITETAVMELSGGESTESEEEEEELEEEEEDISQTSTTNDNLSDAPSSSATKQQPKAKEAQNPTDLPDNNRLCPECGETYHSKDFRKHQKTHTKPTTYECDVCHKVLQSKYNLMNHLKIHRELRTEEQYICEICAKAFKTSYQLNKHQVMHSDEKPYVCPHCPMTFKRLQGLTLHKLGHTGEKPLVCKVCGQSFRAHMTLQMHMRLHTGERPHSCKYCDKKYIGLPSLNAHYKNNHPEEYPQVCGICGGRFKTEKTLQEHLQKKHIIMLVDSEAV